MGSPVFHVVHLVIVLDQLWPEADGIDCRSPYRKEVNGTLLIIEDRLSVIRDLSPRLDAVKPQIEAFC